MHYVYCYLREDGTPYYVGKGKGDRVWNKRQNEIKVPSDPSQIVLMKKDLSNKQACDLEKKLIAFFGRKDLGTGILRNRTDGGEGGDTVSTKMWITDGVNDKYHPKKEEIPEGWKRGRSNCIFNDSDNQRQFSLQVDPVKRGKAIKKAWDEGKMDKRVLPKKKGPMSEKHKKSIGKKVVIDNIEYDTQASAADILGVSRPLISHWIKIGKATRSEQ